MDQLFQQCCAKSTPSLAGSQPLLLYAPRARCQRFAFCCCCFHCCLTNSDAGETSRCQTWSAQSQQQVRRQGRNAGLSWLIQTRSRSALKFKGTVQSNGRSACMADACRGSVFSFALLWRMQRSGSVAQQ